MTDFPVFVSHSQLSVFDASLTNPFNDWTPAHVAQGFSWRLGSVSFMTLSETGKYNIGIVEACSDVAISSSSIRVIVVPFLVPSAGLIEITSISDGHRLELAPGEYELRFEESAELAIRLVFIKGGERRFSILRADPNLAPAYPLLGTAEPA